MFKVGDKVKYIKADQTLSSECYVIVKVEDGGKHYCTYENDSKWMTLGSPSAFRLVGETPKQEKPKDEVDLFQELFG